VDMVKRNAAQIPRFNDKRIWITPNRFIITTPNSTPNSDSRKGARGHPMAALVQKQTNVGAAALSALCQKRTLR
jgi:hypothetical protein